MADDFDVKVEGAEEVGKALDKLAWAVTPRGMGQVLGDIGLVLKRRSMKSFRGQEAPEFTGEGPGGNRWEPLALSTIKSREFYRSKAKKSKGHLRERKTRKKGRAAKTLQDTGTLRRSITTDTSWSSASVTVGTPLEYGLYQHGGTKPYTIVPKSAKALSFVSAWGDVVFTKKVHHPGLPARPFLGYDKSDIEGILKLIVSHLGRAAG